MAKKAVGTPATVLLTAERVPFELHPYDVSPDAPDYGALVAQALASRRRRCSRRSSPMSMARSRWRWCR
jgi:Cys-tRNA(Pro)/Cys-tRNA(Cys) deacylase